MPRRTRYDKKFARIARRLQDYPIARSSHTSGWDLFEDLTLHSSRQLFLGVFGDLAIQDLLREFGFWDALLEKGIRKPIIQLELDDPYRHIFRVYDEHESPANLVVELMFRRTQLTVHVRNGKPEARYPCLLLEWILLQNPHLRFNRNHPALPAQEYPGLGLGEMVLGLITRMALTMHLEGIVTVPANLNSALFFLTFYQAVSPRKQGELLAIAQAAKKYGRFQIVWAEQWGDLIDEDTGQSFNWDPDDMVQPLKDPLKTLFGESADYEQELENYQLRLRVRPGIDVECLDDGQVKRVVQS